MKRALPALALVALAGCGFGPTNSLLTVDQREQQASLRIEQARLQLMQGNPSLADSFLRDGVRLLGGDSPAYLKVARRLTDQGQAAAAVTLLEEATRSGRPVGRSPLIQGALAEAARQVGNKPLSERALAEAQRLAEEVLREAPRLKPDANDPETIARLTATGEFFTDPTLGKRPQDAQTVLAIAHRNAPRNLEALLALSEAHAALKTPEGLDTAIVLQEKALRLAPERFEPRAALGWSLLRRAKSRDELNSALLYLREAADLAPEVADIRLGLGMVYEGLGLTEAALGQYGRALLLRPGFTAAAEREAALRALLPSPSPKPSPTPAPTPASPTPTPAPKPR